MRISANSENLKEMYEFYREKKKEDEVEFTFHGKACEITLGKPPIIKKRSSRLVEEDLLTLQQVLLGEDLELFYRSCEEINHVRVIGKITWPVIPQECESKIEDEEWLKKARKYLELKKKAEEASYFLFRALDKLSEMNVMEIGEEFYFPLDEVLLPRNYEIREEENYILARRKIGKKRKEIFLLTKQSSPEEVIRKIANYNFPEQSKEEGRFSLEIFDKELFERLLKSMRRRGKKKLSKVKEGKRIIEERIAQLNYAYKLMRPTLKLLQPYSIYACGSINYFSSSPNYPRFSWNGSSRLIKILFLTGLISTVSAGLYMYFNQPKQSNSSQGEKTKNTQPPKPEPKIDLSGDYDGDGFTGYEELSLGFNPFNPQEKIFLPIRNDTVILHCIGNFSDYRDGSNTDLSDTSIENFQRIVNGCLGFDPQLEAMGLNRTQIAKIYRINVISSAYLRLNSIWPLIGVEWDKECLLNHGKLNPSNDLTLLDKIVEQYIAQSEFERFKENLWKARSICDALGWWASPSMKFNVITFSNNYTTNDFGSLIYNPDYFKQWNALLDGRLNETSYRPSLSDFEKSHIIPTFEFFWGLLPDNFDDTELTKILYTSTPGYIEFAGGFPPAEWSDLGLISALNKTIENKRWLKDDGSLPYGLKTMSRIFDLINSTNPEVLYEYSGPRHFVEEYFGWNVYGCQFRSSFNIKLIASKGIPVVVFYEIWKEPSGHITGHHSCIYRLNDKMVYEKKRIAVDPNNPYWVSIPKTIELFSNFGWEFLKLYVYNPLKERNPFVLVYDSNNYNY